MKRFIVNLPDELHEGLRQQSFKNHKSMSQLIVDVLSTPGNAPMGPIAQESQNTPKPVMTPSERIASLPKDLRKTFVHPRGELDAEDYT